MVERDLPIARKPIDLEHAQVARRLTQPNPAFDGSTLLEVVERGELNRIWLMLYDLESGQPG
jgi:hypothetical protein